MTVSLTAEEIAALKEGIDQGLIDTDSNRHVRGDAKTFIFGMDSGHSIVSSQILILLHERFIRYLHKSAALLLGEEAQFQFGGMRYIKYEEYRANIGAPLVIGHFDLQPSRSKILALCGMALPALLMERFFGGHFSGIATDREDLSGAEEAIMRRFMGYVVESLKLAWAEIFAFTPSQPKLEYSLHHAATYELQDYIAVADFEIIMSGVLAQSLEICYPFQLFRSILHLLQDRGHDQREKISPDWKRALQKAVLEVPLTVTSILTEPVVNLAWIMHMDKGTTLPITPPHQTSLRIEGREFAMGILGSASNKAAVRISHFPDNK